MRYRVDWLTPGYRIIDIVDGGVVYDELLGTRTTELLCETMNQLEERKAQMLDQKSAREAGMEATAGHFKNVDEAMEAVNRLEPLLARAALAEIACSYPEDVLKVAREVEQETQGPRCPNSVQGREASVLANLSSDAQLSWHTHAGQYVVIVRVHMDQATREPGGFEVVAPIALFAAADVWDTHMKDCEGWRRYLSPDGMAYVHADAARVVELARSL